MIYLTKENDVVICFASQNYTEEITDIKHKYELPVERLYIMFVEDKAAGYDALIGAYILKRGAVLKFRTFR